MSNNADRERADRVARMRNGCRRPNCGGQREMRGKVAATTTGAFRLGERAGTARREAARRRSADTGLRVDRTPPRRPGHEGSGVTCLRHGFRRPVVWRRDGLAGGAQVAGAGAAGTGMRAAAHVSEVVGGTAIAPIGTAGHALGLALNFGGNAADFLGAGNGPIVIGDDADGEADERVGAGWPWRSVATSQPRSRSSAV